MLDFRKEIDFWTQIMRDHAEFQYTSLSPNEQQAINTAAYFMNLFTKLNQENKLSDIALEKVIADNKAALMQFLQFKQTLLAKLMQCKIEITMTPTFLNHMLNEAMEFYQVLCMDKSEVIVNQALEKLRLHQVWLLDAAGHANLIATQLDVTEYNYIKEAKEFKKQFDKLFYKAYEMYFMFNRTGLGNGNLAHFNHMIESIMNQFIAYLERLEKILRECQIYSTGTFKPLVVNHMKREELYYLYRYKMLN